MTALIAALAAGAYANTLGHDFTLDDPLAITNNLLIRDLRNLPTFFTTHYWAGDPNSPTRGLYRPLTITTFALNYALGGAAPAGYHILNVALHALATALAHRLLVMLFGTGFATAGAALLFAVHPVHTEAVANVVGRAEMLALCGMLGCCLAYDRARRAAASRRRGACGVWAGLAVTAYLGGVLSKEIGIVAPALVLLNEWVRPEGRWLLRGRFGALLTFLGFAGAAVLFLTLRAAATESGDPHGVFRDCSTLERVATATRVSGEYLLLLLVPWRLLADYWLSEVPIATSLATPAVLASLSVWTLLLAVAVTLRRRIPQFTWGVAALALLLLPVSNLLLPIGVLKAERILYSPSMGFVAAVAALLALPARRPRLRPVVWLVLIGVSTAYAGRTWLRNRDWRDPETLCRATLAVSPMSPVFNANYATLLARQGRIDEARERYNYVLSLAPGASDVAYKLARLEQEAQNHTRAIELFRRVLAREPDRLNAHINLGRSLAASGDWDNAIASFERVRELDANNPTAHLTLVKAQLDRNRPDAALPVITAALQRFPQDARTHLIASMVYRLLGQTREAEEFYQRAIVLDPTLKRER